MLQISLNWPDRARGPPYALHQYYQLNFWKKNTKCESTLLISTVQYSNTLVSIPTEYRAVFVSSTNEPLEKDILVPN